MKNIKTFEGFIKKYNDEIILNESFDVSDDDMEMIFVDLLDNGLKVKFGKYDSQTIYVDIYNSEREPAERQVDINHGVAEWGRITGHTTHNHLDVKLVKEPILKWIELVSNNKYNWWIETSIRSDVDFRWRENPSYNKKYFDEIIARKEKVRIVINKSYEDIESFFINSAKDYFVNFDHIRNVLYISKDIHYKYQRYANRKPSEDDFFRAKYRREITGQFNPVDTEYKNDNKLKYLRNTKTGLSVNVERETESYKKIFYALEKDLQNLRKKCKFTIHGKDIIEIDFKEKNED